MSLRFTVRCRRGRLRLRPAAESIHVHRLREPCSGSSVTRSPSIRWKRIASARAFVSLARATAVPREKAKQSCEGASGAVRDAVPQSGVGDSLAWRTLNSGCHKLADVGSRLKSKAG